MATSAIDSEDDRTSTHLDVAPMSSPLWAREMDADAAAGGPVPSDSDASGIGHHPPCRLAVQATGGSTVASATAVKLQRELGDAVVLQSRASAAIDRIARQQAALRRFPMACPSCGTLNAPRGLSWGSGDIVACQGCSQSFVPLGQGLQESDLGVLRLAVQQLGVYAERVQYFEQGLRHSGNAGQSDSARPSHATALKSPTRSPKRNNNASAVARTHVSPCSKPCLRRFANKEELCDGPEKGMDTSADQRHAPRQLSEMSGAALQPRTGAAFQPRTAGIAESPKLLSLMDTGELVTSSSAESTPAHIHGRKLTRRLDSEQHTLEALQQARQRLANLSSMKRPPWTNRLEREEGETTSASEDDARFRAGSWLAGKLGPSTSFSGKSSVDETLAALRASTRASPSSTLLGQSIAGSPADAVAKADDAIKAASAGAAGGEFDGIRVRLVLVLFVIHGCFCLLHLALDVIVDSYSSMSSFGRAIVVAALAASGSGMYSRAHHELELSKMMVTAPTDQVRRAVRLRIGGVHWELAALVLTVEETFGASCAFGQLMLFSFFESLGLSGPPSYGWLAVICHALGVVAFTVAGRRHFEQKFKLPHGHREPSSNLFSADACASQGCRGVPSLWLCIAATNWTVVTLASVTWWHQAASLGAVSPPAFLRGGRLPALASIAVHATNFWLARHADQPALLSVCVALAGVSMAICCYERRGDDLVLPDTAKPWTAEIYVVFCAMSAWVVFQELFRNL